MRRLRNSIFSFFFAKLTWPYFGIFGRGGLISFLSCLLCAASFFSSHAQNRADIVPSYSHIGTKGLPTVQASIKIFPPSVSVNTEDLTIAIATDPQGYVYSLSFGNGVDKRDASGTLIDGNFITGLKNPLDIAIDENGLIYIADYEASGETSADNGQIKIFDQQGNYLDAIWTSFYRPLGVDVDEENVYIAEYNDGKQGAERTPMSRVRIVNKVTKAVKASNANILIPLRIAVNSEKTIYVSKAGNNDAAVVMLDQNLNLLGTLPNIISPGSVVIDAYDYVHVIEYSGIVDFSDFINFNSLSLSDFQDIAHDIDDGIDAEAFGIKIFSPDNTFEYFFKNMLDFPVDIAFNSCDRMYVDNAGGIEWLLGYPEKLHFDLEIYKRSPSGDVTPPVALCIGSYTINLAAGETVSLDPEDFNDGSYDACGTVSFNLSKLTFTESDEGSTVIDFIVTDEQGQKSKCEVTIQVNVEEEADTEKPAFTLCENQTFSADAGECGAIVNYTTPTATDNSGAITPVLTKGPASGGFFPLGSTEVSYTATDPSGNSSTCTFTVTVTDDEAPELTRCPENVIFEVPFGETGKVVTFEAPTAVDECSVVTISQTEGLPSGSNFPIGPTVNTFVLQDESGNKVPCSFTVTITEATDTEDPVFEDCPATIEVSAEPGECGAVVDYDFPTATDNSEEPVTVSKTGGPDPGTFLSIGDHIVYFKAVDEAGNTATCELKISITDEEDPKFTNCPGNMVVELPAGDSDVTVNFPEPPASDNCDFVITQTAGQSSGSRFSEGTHKIEFTVTDNSGRTSTCSFDVIVNPAQTTTLEISCPGDQVLDLGGQCNILLPDYKNLVTATGGAIVNQSPPAETPISKATTVTFTASLNGENVTCDFVVDLINSPVLTLYCLEDHTVEPDATGNFALPDYTLQANVDGACGALTYTQAPAKGTLISEDTEIILTVSDERGKEGSCSFNLKIKKTEIPDVKCKPATLSLDESGNARLEPEDVWDSGSVDPETIERLGVDREIFTCNDLGAQSVKLTVYFKDGTTNSCTTQVTVVDEQKPVLECIVGVSVRLNSFGSATVTASELTGNVADNCGSPTVTIDKASFTEADLGDNTVTVTAIDESGNVETCKTTVTIVPYEGGNAGGITCPEDATVPLNDNGEVTVSIKYEGDADVEFEMDKSFFTCHDLGVNTVTVTYTGDYEGSCTSKITIVDVTSPIINCVSSLDLRLGQDGTANLLPTDISPEISDNCGIETISLSKTSFNTSDLGPQQVVLTVIDFSGNESKCSTTVNVLPYGSTESEIQCVSSIDLELDTNGEAVLNIKDLFTGGPESAEYTVSKENFDCSDIGEQNVVFTFKTAEQEGSCTILVRITDPANHCEVDPVDPDEPGFTLILYPNPSRGFFKVKSASGITLERAEVFDMRGRYICTVDLVGNVNAPQIYSVDLRGYQSGVYTLKFYSAEEEYIRRAIISPE